MVLVRVHKIESIRDPDGNYGKRIELVEERNIPTVRVAPETEEARLAQSIFQAIQTQIPLFKMQQRIFLPKIILFLTEEEYEKLGVEFNVNQVYEMKLSDKTISFRRIE